MAKIMSRIYAFDWENSENATRFDYETNKWQKIDLSGALIHVPRRHDFALANIEENMFITGGCIGGFIGKSTNICQFIKFTTSGEVQQIVSFHDLNIERQGHSALSIGNKMYVFGGRNERGCLSAIECSNGIRRWTLEGNLCEKRDGATGAVLNGAAYVIGGTNDGGNYLNSMERFDPREGNRCVPMKAMKESRDGAAAAEHKGLIYATGGLNKNGGSDTVEIYDPRRDEWTDGPKMNIDRCLHALVSDGNRLLAIGGILRNGTMEELVRNWTWTTSWTTKSAKSPINSSIRAVYLSQLNFV